MKKTANKQAPASRVFFGETLAAEIAVLRDRLTALEEGGEWRERALKAERDLAHGTLRFVDENGKVQKELAEAKSKLDKAEADLKAANQRGLNWMEKANHWQSRATIAEKRLTDFQKFASRSRENDPVQDQFGLSPEPDCFCVGRQYPDGTPDLGAKRSHIGRWRGWDITSEIGCPHCGGEGYQKKANPRRHYDGGECTCPPEEIPQIPQKPLRLLVEVVPQKDERHGTREYIRTGVVHITSPIDGASFSVQELPPMPSLDQLVHIGNMAYRSDLGAVGGRKRTHDFTRAILKACGLEVSE